MLSLLGWAMCWWLHNSRNVKGLRNATSGGKIAAPLTPVPAQTNRYCAKGESCHPLRLSAPSSTSQHWLSRTYNLFYAKTLRITHRWSSVVTGNPVNCWQWACALQKLRLTRHGGQTLTWHRVLQTCNVMGFNSLGVVDVYLNVKRDKRLFWNIQ